MNEACAIVIVITLQGTGRGPWRMYVGDVLYALRFMSRNMADSISIRFRHYLPESTRLLWSGLSPMAAAIRVFELSNTLSMSDEELADGIAMLSHVEELDLSHTCAGEQVWRGARQRGDDDDDDYDD